MQNNKLIFYTTLLKSFALEFFLQQVEVIFVRNPACILQPKIPLEVRVCSSCQRELTSSEGGDLCVLLSSSVHC